MPTVQIPVTKLRENWIRDQKSLLHRYGPDLEARGFNLSLPIDVVRTDEHMTLSQDVEGRVPNSRFAELAHYIARGDHRAVEQLYALFLAEGDDRAEAMGNLSVDMPEGVEVYADFGTKSPGHSTDRVDGERMANWLLCQKVLLLIGARQEPL